MKKFVCTISAILCVSLAAAGLTACGPSTAENNDDYVTIVVGNWPQETSPETRAVYEDYVKKL